MDILDVLSGVMGAIGTILLGVAIWLLYEKSYLSGGLLLGFGILSYIISDQLDKRYKINNIVKNYYDLKEWIKNPINCGPSVSIDPYHGISVCSLNNKSTNIDPCTECKKNITGPVYYNKYNIYAGSYYRYYHPKCILGAIYEYLTNAGRGVEKPDN